MEEICTEEIKGYKPTNEGQAAETFRWMRDDSTDYNRRAAGQRDLAR